MPVTIRKPAPFFKAEAVVDGAFKTVSLDDYKGRYVVLFAYPLDFTFVCPTEIIAFSDAIEKFEALNCSVVGMSCDSKFSHLAWINTPRERGGLGPMRIPLLADFNKKIAKDYGILIEDPEDEDDGVAFRGVFIIDDKQRVRQVTINDLPVGRNVDEILRLVEAFQYTDVHGEVCPAGWRKGDLTMVDDVDKSLEYFAKVNATSAAAEEVKEDPVVVRIDSEGSFDKALEAAGSSKAVVANFSATWCGKCKALKPKLVEMAGELKDKAMFVSVDADDLDALAAKYEVRSLPTTVIFKAGAVVGSYVGANPQHVREEIDAKI